ncbi:hypothetical protein LLH06_10540 [Mucilaginibacter daejeonensis]|uniref:hypothetical protein n=1 Tax=Mucilaginibacter daejeonensis TaxID=398049 RepID=UPI001D17A0C5|nr:hypothetical protein [Mucilaginibacter daejeonensis]UEG51410.1 hypothetical protein LLH06_10540 [Mucilaginibacter daejeonensis]
MKTLDEAQNVLLSVSDEQWLKLVGMLTYGVLELNARKLSKVEVMYSVGHYPAMHFRLTTILDDPTDGNPLPQVSGFRFAFDQDIDDDVYIESLSSDGFWDDYLEKMRITHVFTTNEVGVKKLYRFINDELHLWDANSVAQITKPEQDVWRDLKTYDEP